MTRILFVCHGNICRSPMAEFIFKKITEDAGVSDQFMIASAAVSTEEIYRGVGNPVYPGAREELARHGISCAGKRAVLLMREDYDRYDLLIGMDASNIRAMHRILGGDPQGKIRKLMEYTERGGDVADPWYSDRFDIAWRDISDGCRGLFEAVRQETYTR